MKNIAPKIIFSTISVLSSTLVSATCLPIQGTIQTQSIDGTVQVGTITMTSSNPTFRKTFGQIVITGGIKGTIMNPGGYPVELAHEIGFPGIGSLISVGDVATFTGPPDKEGNYPTMETAPLAAAPTVNNVPYDGVFNGWTFPDGLIVTGTVGTLTGINAFTYKGKTCK